VNGEQPAAAAIALSAMNFGAYPMPNGHFAARKPLPA
jgi:hypothetical protein